MDYTDRGQVHAENLELQIKELLQKKQRVDFDIVQLEQKIAHKALRQESLDFSLREAKRIAAEIEENASLSAAKTLAEAEAIAQARRRTLAAIEQEIALLQAEIKGQSPQRPSCGAADQYFDSNFMPDRTEARGAAGDDNIYSMKLVGFLNARHFVFVEGRTGPVHAHSWQVEIQVKVPREIKKIIEFNQVSRDFHAVLTPYENTILNHARPFDLIQPTTENIAMFFFNRLDGRMAKLGLKISQLNLWEAPTRGIHVDNFNTALDEQIASELKAQAGNTAAPKVAATLPTPDYAAPDQKKKSKAADKKVVTGPLPISAGFLREPYSVKQYLLAAALILLISFAAYGHILLPPSEQRFPWGSDSWGHLFKAEMLYEEILQGNYYPQFTPYWYNGVQPFRYWAPLPYYVLAALRAASGDIFTAGNLYIYLCALMGALFWLLLSRRIGLWPAIMAALVWLLWQDNVRVAFSEGNMPRVLATALLPFLFASFFRILAREKSYGPIIAVILTVQLVLLCHAMIAAVYCLSLALFAFFLWVFRGCGIKDVALGLLVLSAGILSSAWWLLPSLSGGITGIDAQAVREVVQFVPARVSLSPLYRFKNIEIFYWGLSLVVLVIAGFVTWRSKPVWAKSLAVCGVILLFITFPLSRAVFITLPLSHLLWPLRFSSFAAMALLAATFAFEPAEKRQQWIRSPYIVGLLLISLSASLLFDCLISFRLLAHTGTRPYAVIQSGELIKQKPGWRVATIDLSGLGSAPSYIYSKIAGLEQVFGWAWQGAVTSRNIMLLNTALEDSYYPFLFRSCVDLGATSLTVKEDTVTDPQAFDAAAARAGFRRLDKFADLSVWKNVDRPYLVQKNPRCLVIGKYAGTIALQFPEVEMAASQFVDDYSLEHLGQYPMLIISGADWHSKQRAEKLISDYALSGGKVIIEMAGMPPNVLAKQPDFLGVYGEPVIIREDIEVIGGDAPVVLSPLWLPEGEWKAYVPLGLDGVELEFSYYDNPAPVLGYKLVEGRKIWFLGANLSYHAYRSGVPESQGLLKRILNLETEYTGDTLIPLLDYEAGAKGYRMSYRLELDSEVIVPVSLLDGLIVELDGRRIETGDYENLLKLQLPAGTHSLKISVEKTTIFTQGKYLGLFSILLVIAALSWHKRTGEL